MKLLLGLGLVIAGLLVLIVALPFLVDLNQYQDRYRPLIEATLNRKVELKDIRLTIWPRLGARVGSFVVQDDPAFRTGPFASLSSLDVGVKLRPLLSGRVEVEELTLRNPVITVIKNKQGRLNVSTIGPQTEAPPKPEAPTPAPSRNPLHALALFAVDRVSIDGGRVTYRDESTAAATEYRVEQLEFLLTSVHLGDSPSLHLAATVHPHNVPIRVDGTFGPLVETFDIKSFAFDLGLGNTAMNLKGRAVGGTIDATVSALQIDSRDLPVAVPLTKPVQLKDLHLTLHTPYPPADETPPVKQLTITDLGVTVMMGGSAVHVKGTAADGLANLTVASGSIQSTDVPIAMPLTKPVEVKDLHATIRAAYPPKDGTLPLDMAEVPDLGLTLAMGSSRMEVIGSLLGGSAKVTAAAKQLMTTDLPIALTLNKPVEIKDLQLTAEVKGQEARLHHLALQVFGGFVRAQGTTGLGVPTPPFTGALTLQGLQLGPALQAVATSHVTMTGTAGGDFKLAGRGWTHPDLVKSLTGTGRFSAKDGVIEGVDLLRQAAMLLKVAGISLDTVKATAFSIIDTEFVAKQGSVTVQRLLLDSHDFQATGRGTVGLDQSLNLTVNLHLSHALSQKITASSPIARVAMQGGRLSLPLLVTGSLQSPSYGLDTKLFTGKVQDQVKDKLTGAISDVLSGTAKPDDLRKQGKDLLKDLFGR